MDKIRRAYEFAREFHRNQKRRSGEPYINHPVEVAIILASDLHMDEDTICAAILHDTVEDTEATLDDLTDRFGATVAELVDGVTKLTQVQVSSMDEKQALNLRKMFLAMSKDIRVLIIKLADRLHNMRTMAALPPAKRILKSRETMDVYAPLADRLGISSIKWELEDLAFFYLQPEEYERIARMVQESRAQREEKTQEAIKILDDELKRVGLTGYQISGRPKHLWSIYQKMRRKRKEFSDIYDLIALRVLTETVGDCYSVLGAVHSLWHPLPGTLQGLRGHAQGQWLPVAAHHGHWRRRAPGGDPDSHLRDAQQGRVRHRGALAVQELRQLAGAHERRRPLGRHPDQLDPPHARLGDRGGDRGPARVPQQPARRPVRARDLCVHAKGRGHEPAARVHAP